MLKVVRKLTWYIHSDILSNTPARSALSAQGAVAKLKESLPFSDGATDLKKVNWQLAFEKPTKIQIGGSWPTGTACKWKGKTGWNVDVLVQMPGVSPHRCVANLRAIC